MQRHANQPMMCLLAVAVLALCSRGALAHGGGLHRWTFNTDVLKNVPTASIRTDAHTTLATCGNWTALNLTALVPSLFSFPWPAPQLNMTLEGNVDLVSYLPSNCTNSINGGLFPNLRFRVWIKQGTRWVSRPPPAGYQAAGYAFTGTCAAPGNLYRNNVTLQDNRFNLGWWGMDSDAVIGLGMNTTDLYPGYQWGAGVNSWFYRNATNPDRARSLVVFATSGPAFCCNVNYDGFPAPDAVLAQGHDCAVAPPH